MSHELKVCEWVTNSYSTSYTINPRLQMNRYTAKICVRWCCCSFMNMSSWLMHTHNESRTHIQRATPSSSACKWTVTQPKNHMSSCCYSTMSMSSWHIHTMTVHLHKWSVIQPRSVWVVVVVALWIWVRDSCIHTTMVHLHKWTIIQPRSVWCGVDIALW